MTHIEKINHKTERDYASFIIGVPESEYNVLCQPENWPVNIECYDWVWFRRSTNSKESFLPRSNPIDIFYQNLRGLRTKLVNFNATLAEADLIAITETGCNESIADGELVPIGFTILRCGRVDVASRVEPVS
ncbi:unnamed protein product [Pieris brassicae]|uniref:Uncharacterized protein n=1 Tax=Pieris brassicae TaxID=7116 RepID=A0A9P0TX98_PIEBR|nr:unnamed protein product [Pieris brassicae]